MRIQKLHIYRFGRFEDFTMEQMSTGMQVIYGVNEAGKSTVMAFIRGVLFGFTTKGKDYIPHEGGVYGGSLTVELPEKGIVTIERTGTKGKGSPKLFYNDGTTGGEDDLRDLLRGLDPAMFDAIFSFDLDGLRGLEQIEADELNDYLFHAGMTGSLSIRQLEKKLEKQEAALFKPSGRKPVLNQNIAELQASEQELRKWRQQNAEYQHLLDQTAKTKARLEEILKAKQENHSHIRKLEKRSSVRPLVEDKQMWESRLRQLPDYGDFPEDGLARFEKWQSQAVTLEAEKAQKEKEQDVLRSKLEQLRPNHSLLEHREALLRLKEEQRWSDEQNNQKISLEQELKTEKEELEVIFENLGSMWNEKRILHTDTGLTSKESLEDAVKRSERLTDQKNILEDELERLERTVQQHKQNEKQLKDQMLSEQTRIEIEAQLDVDETAAGRQIEKEQLEKQLDILKKNKSPSRKAYTILFYGMTVSGAGLCIWLVSAGLPLVAIIAAILFFAFGFFTARASQTSNNAGLIAEIDKKIEQLNKDLERAENQADPKEIKEKLEEDDALAQRHALLKERLRQDQQVYEEAVVRYDELQRNLGSIRQNIKDWCKKHGFPDTIKHTQLPDIIKRAAEAKARIRKRNRLQENIAAITDRLAQRHDEIKRLCEVFQITYDHPGHAIQKLNQRLEEEEGRRNEAGQLTANLESLKEQSVALTDKIGHFNKQCRQLMEQAGVANEEEYRQKAKAWSDSRSILEQLQSVNGRIVSILPDEKERNSMIREILKDNIDEDSKIKELEEQNDLMDEEERSLNKKMAELQAEMAQLEEGGTYAELLHRFQIKKDEFERGARKWAVYKTALQLLKRAKEEYRSERLPKVVVLAERYFKRMTEDRYHKLFAPIGKGFVVERFDGFRFSPEQLSRGTAEQLYFCFRLALAQIYESPSPYPVIMDDILVNFDRSRAEKAVELIREAAKHQQMLFFTCHSHMKEHFEEQEILRLHEENAVPHAIRSSS